MSLYKRGAMPLGDTSVSYTYYVFCKIRSGIGGSRTRDQQIKSLLLYQLSYNPSQQETLST